MTMIWGMKASLEILMKQNKYDDPAFFARYSQMARSIGGLEAAGEWPAFRALLPDLRDKRVLDLGCDTGSLSVEFANRGAASVVAVDISADAIEEARRRHADSNVTFAVSELAALPIPDASVDLILSYDVFEHVSNPFALLRECRRVLATGGDMLIGTWGWGHPFAHHFFAEMPVPWAHLFVSDATLQRACRRVCRWRTSQWIRRSSRLWTSIGRTASFSGRSSSTVA